MQEVMVYVGSFGASAMLMLVGWLKVSHCVHIENEIDVPEWERV